MLKRLSVLLLMVVISAACVTPPAEPTATPAPTNTPVPSPTSTPVPTATLTPTPDLAAIASAQETEAVEAKIQQIDEVLQEYNYSTSEGSLAWVQEEKIEIHLDTYMEELFVPLADESKFSNYYLYTEITWDSSSGYVLCGIYFHSGRNYEKSAQYRFSTLRLSGLPLWAVDYFRYGGFNSSPKFSTSAAINQDAGATNEYLFFIQSHQITAYVNQEKLGKGKLSKLSEGRIAAFAFQESGITACEFSNTWIWDLGD